MEPVKGGSLVHLPEEAADVLRAVNPDESLPSWALRFAASLPGVLTVLSGMSTPDQVRDNTQIMRSFHPLAHEEDEALARGIEALLRHEVQRLHLTEKNDIQERTAPTRAARCGRWIGTTRRAATARWATWP